MSRATHLKLEQCTWGCEQRWASRTVQVVSKQALKLRTPLPSTVFQSQSHEAQAGLELTIQSRVAWNSCLHLSHMHSHLLF